MDKEELINKYIDQRMSINEIARLEGKCYYTIRYWLVKFGIPLRERVDAMRESIRSGKRKYPRHHKPLSDETRMKISGSRKKWGDENAAGVRIRVNGYVEYTRGEHKGRVVHDVIMEEHIGRSLLPGEVVHHINGDKTDNRIENLQLLTNVEHSRLHASLRTNHFNNK